MALRVKRPLRRSEKRIQVAELLALLDEEERREKRRGEPNVEEGEKPVAPPTSLTSEDTHGGSEATGSVENSPNTGAPSGSEDAEREEGRGEAEAGASGENEERPDAPSGSGERQAEHGKAEERDKSEGGGAEKQTESGAEREEGHVDTGEHADASGGVGEQQQQEEASEERQRQEDAEEGGSEEQEDSAGWRQGGTRRNSSQAFELAERRRGRLAAAVYRFIEYLSDVERGVSYHPPSPETAYDFKKLMFRRFTGAPPSKYVGYKRRSGVVVVLDNSGSMSWLDEELREILTGASMRGDAVVYIAPNGVIEEKIERGRRTAVEHEKAVDEIKRAGLPVLYIGDFDGGNTPIELSWSVPVFWIAPEKRYRRFRSHDWVQYDESQFRGSFARALSEDEIIDALKKLASCRNTRCWIDYHEADTFEDDYFEDDYFNEYE